MKTKDLTKTINERLSALQADVSNLPTGGGLETLKARLMHLKDKISNFAGYLDGINGVKTPENAPTKDGIPNDFNDFEHDHGGCLAETPYPQN